MRKKSNMIGLFGQDQEKIIFLKNIVTQNLSKGKFQSFSLVKEKIDFLTFSEISDGLKSLKCIDERPSRYKRSKTIFIDIDSFRVDQVESLVLKIKNLIPDVEILMITNGDEKKIEYFEDWNYFIFVIKKDLKKIKKMIQKNIVDQYKKNAREMTSFLQVNKKVDAQFLNEGLSFLKNNLEADSLGFYEHSGKKEDLTLAPTFIMGNPVKAPKRYIQKISKNEIEILKPYRFGHVINIPFQKKNSFILMKKEGLTLFQNILVREYLIKLREIVTPNFNFSKVKVSEEAPLFEVNMGMETVLYDLRDTINTIKSVGYLFNPKLKESNQFSDLKSIIYNSCDDFLFLVTDLINEQKHRELHYRSFKIDDFFNYISGKYNKTLEFYNISLKLSFNEGIEIDCDGIKLKRAIGYLINSSRKVLVYEGIEGPKIMVNFIEKRKTFLFVIHNNGPHFSKKEQKKLFESMDFEEDFEHIGLGYVLAKKIVEDHQGTLKMKSDKSGTQFSLEIPKGQLAA